MSEEKQIVEMIEIVKPFVSGCACEEESGSCEFTDCRSCNARVLVNKLREAGYRKQSEGEWIKDNKSKFEHRYYCSVCSFYLLGSPTNYCEECGAKMKGE